MNTSTMSSGNDRHPVLKIVVLYIVSLVFISLGVGLSFTQAFDHGFWPVPFGVVFRCRARTRSLGRRARLRLAEGQGMTNRKIRVLVGKPGLDGHDRGAKTIAAVLRDHGMEVIYTGLHQTPDMIAETALQEDVDVVGLSILSGAHMTLFPRIKAELEKRGMGHVLLTGGGIISKEDMDRSRVGFARLFGPGTKTEEIALWIQAEMQKRWAREGVQS
jgi:methylmalonyl-CoA mutase C-terminal domain/subunit